MISAPGQIQKISGLQGHFLGDVAPRLVVMVLAEIAEIWMFDRQLHGAFI